MAMEVSSLTSVSPKHTAMKTSSLSVSPKHTETKTSNTLIERAIVEVKEQFEVAKVAAVAVIPDLAHPSAITQIHRQTTMTTPPFKVARTTGVITVQAQPRELDVETRACFER
jgi:hypothetical protein